MAFIKVTAAKYIRDYKIQLEFNDNVKGIIDLKDELWGDVFEPLKNIDFFRKFHLKYGTIEWPNGADLAPEYLHELATKSLVKTVEN